MNPPLSAIAVSFLAPVLGLALLLDGLARVLGLRPKGPRWCSGLVLCALAIASLPCGGLPLARWLAGVVDHWSVPTIALLASALFQRLFGIDLLRRKDREAAWLFGGVAGLLLYPLALGWGPFDPYGLGWHFGPLFIGVAVLSVALISRDNRFGVVLVLAIAAWHVRVAESANYWDCLLDPFYCVVSIGVLGCRAWDAQRKHPRP